MLAIILCAGKGSRTGLNYPKCLYNFGDGTSLISRNIENLKKCGFRNSNIILATGFSEKLVKNKTKFKYIYIKNKKFRSTNMVYTLNEVLKKKKDDDIYVIYSDIVYDYNYLKKLILSKKDIVTLVDKSWLKKWKLKKNYREDFESLKVRKDELISLGEKTYDLHKIDGRFIGITKFTKKIIKKFKDKKVITNELKKNEKLDFTGFLMELIKKKYTINVLLAKIKWFEFDTKYDFNIYKRLINKLK